MLSSYCSILAAMWRVNPNLLDFLS
jgi:hypothetical protein